MSEFSSWLLNYCTGVFVESWVFVLVFLIVFALTFVRYPTIHKKGPVFWYSISVLWIFLIQGDSLLLGTFSRLEWGDGAPSYIGDLSLRAVKVSGVYLHEVLGGVDSYSIYREGPEYFSIRIILRQLLPLWVGVATIRFVVTAIAFFGIYCWTRLHYRLGYSISFALSALYAVGFDWSTGVAYQSAGLACFPFLLYLLFSRRMDVSGIFLLFGGALFLIGLAGPQYLLPMFLVTIGTIYVFQRPESRKYLCFGATAVSVIWIANYMEVLYAMGLLADESMRIASVASYQDRTWGLFVTITRYFFGLTARYTNGSWPFLLVVISLIYFVSINKNRRAFVAVGLIVVILYGRLLLFFVPFDEFGLTSLETYNIFLYYAAVPVLFILLAQQIGEYSAKKDHYKKRYVQVLRLLSSAIMGVALAFFLLFKYYTLRDMMFNGGLDQLTEIQNLKQHKEWSKPNYKVVTLPYRINPSSVTSYGLSAFNGAYYTLFPYRQAYYWHNILTETGAGEWFNHRSGSELIEEIEFSSPTLFELLGLVNVRYIISSLPINSLGLKKVSAPPDGSIPPRGMPNSMSHYFWFFRNDWIFDTAYWRYYFSDKYAYVYEIADAFPLLYAPQKVMQMGAISDKEMLEMVINGRRDRNLVMRNVDLGLRGAAKISVIDIMKEINGYNFLVEVYKPGFVIINLPFHKWWRASIEGSSVQVYPGNFIQTVIDVPRGKFKISLSYERPLLADKIGAVIKRQLVFEDIGK